MKNKNQPRGLRNNNPLNIHHSASRWQGVRAEQTDKAFVQFTSMMMGYRAAWRILESYYNHFEAQQVPFTARNIILRWAPPDENDSEAYIRSICRLTSLAGNEALKRPSSLSIRSSRSSRSPQSGQSFHSPRSPQSAQSFQSPRSSRSAQSSQNTQSSPPPFNDAYTAYNPQAKTKLIDLLAAMTCIENGISMNDVDRRAIERGLERAF